MLQMHLASLTGPAHVAVSSDIMKKSFSAAYSRAPYPKIPGSSGTVLAGVLGYRSDKPCRRVGTDGRGVGLEASVRKPARSAVSRLGEKR